MKNNANPVELTLKKDIYIIKNDINNKVYIGQAKNTSKRFKSHCKPSSLRDGTLVDRAIQKYGSDHFYVEVLESQIENYNEREQYWIQQYNSLKPNGYNILSGGEEPPRFTGEQHPSTTISDDTLLKIKDDLEHTQLSLKEIAVKYNTSKRQVLGINDGSRRVNPQWSYPLRKKPNSSYKLNQEQVQQIIKLLQETYLLHGQIARQFNVGPKVIALIDQGKAYRQEGVTYPIRCWKSSGTILFTPQDIKDITDLLKNTKQSMNSISKKYHVGVSTIMMINSGSSKKYRLNNEQYPLRPYNEKRRRKK